MSERQFAVSGDWALGADSLEWILYRRRSREGGWEAVSFVASTREVLARCMGEKGCPAACQSTFDQWRETRQMPSLPVPADQPADGGSVEDLTHRHRPARLDDVE